MKGGTADPRGDLLIVGAGGHASKIVPLARALGLRLLGYISTEPTGTEIDGLRVLGDIGHYEVTRELRASGVHIAIGEVSVRQGLWKTLTRLGSELVTLVSDRSAVSESAEIGAGSCVLQNVVIQTRARIGVCCIIDSGAIVEHDAVVGSFANVSPGAVLCGRVQIGPGAIVGAGAIVIEKTVVGENSLVGAGAVVLRDVPPNSVAVGNPARVLRERRAGERYLKL